MRDERRIEVILKLVAEIWRRDPDMRFNQLLYILQSEYSSSNGGEGKVVEKVDDNFSKVGFDLFNLEDDRFIEYLRRRVSHE